MAQILHVHILKKDPPTYFKCVFSRKKNLVFFPTVQMRKKISREGSSNLATDAKQYFWFFLLNIIEINVKFEFKKSI
jgi:hypothetical protein